MEFQAIVLAGGRGTRMLDLSSNCPKCLLPIGNRPMIWYPVRMLEKAGFNDINIITLNSIKTRVENELKLNCGIKANLHVVGVDDSTDDDDFGTANSLYLLKDKIVTDCMIVSCDLISNVSIQMMANFYRATSASFVALLADNVEQSLELPVPGSKGKYAPERDMIGLEVDTNRLLFFGSEAEVEEIKLKESIVHKFPKITWTTKLQDAHLYIMKKCLIDYIIDNKKIFSLKYEFLPYLVKKQFSSHKRASKDPNASTNYSTNKKSKPKLFDYVKEDELTQLLNRTSLSKYNPELLTCYAFLQADGFCLRANNLAIYAEANRQITGKILPYYQRDRHDSIGKYDKSQVSSDSIVGEGAKIGDKALVKRSVIGRNCVIGEKSKITNSVIMENVKIGDNAIIQGSIIGANTKLSQKSELKDCFVGFDQDIISTGKYSNETIHDVDSFIEE